MPTQAKLTTLAVELAQRFVHEHLVIVIAAIADYRAQISRASILEI